MKIMIIGGTSGIGLALATHYLQQGAQVAICGRNLKRVDSGFIERHANIRMYEFDITDKSAVADAINDFAKDSLDMLIVTAGLYANKHDIQKNPEVTLQMFQTNVNGLSYAFELASQKMLMQESGHLVAVSSMAGLLRDYPGSSLYSATKRVVIALCAAYRKALAPFSITVTSIIPGYIDTAKLRELNGGDASHKPFLVSEQQAVQRIVSAIAQRHERCVFPWQLHWLVNFFNFLPLKIRQIRIR